MIHFGSQSWTGLAESSKCRILDPRGGFQSGSNDPVEELRGEVPLLNHSNRIRRESAH